MLCYTNQPMWILLLVMSWQLASSLPAPHVNGERLRRDLEGLSQFGRNPEGGVTRVAFSEADRASREFVMGLMRDAGLAVRVDPAGNIYGRREGAQKLPALLFGSHIDSVPKGGNFDGDVGSLGAIEVVRALKEQKVLTRHPLEVVVWTNEEGHHFGSPLFGSRAAVGLVESAELDRRDQEGVTLAEWLRRYGLDPARIGEARRNPAEIAVYLELHIEQGGVLEKEARQIGVVEGIVGIRRWTCIVEGFANHAGTTPMDQRQDALLAAARAALLVRSEVRAQPGRQVGTVGYLRVEPGARNIIPGRAEFPIELRDLSGAKIEALAARIFSGIHRIEQEERVKIACQPLSYDAPALTDPRLREAIGAAAKEAGLSTLALASGAGHDAQAVARLAPIGMIFIPSVGGISHSPLERSEWHDIANGAEVLYRTVLKLDRMF